MSDTNVRVVFGGNAEGAVRASDRTADSIKRIGLAGREAAHGVDEIRERAEAGTRAIGEERRAIEGLKVASLLGGAATAGKWGVMAGGIAALGATAIGATAALAPLAGSVAVLPGLLTGAALAMGTVKLATNGVSEALKGNKKALAELTPAGRAFVATLKSFEPQLDKLRTSAQKGLFPGLLAALNEIKKPAVFGVINTAIGEMAKSLGGVAAQFGKVIGSQKFLQTFGVVAQAAAHWMQQFGTFAVKGFDAMISLTKAAIPLTNWMGDLSVRFATFLDNSIKAASASGRLQQFFAGVRQQITLIGQTLGSLGSALVSVFRVAMPFGNALFAQLAKGAEAVKKFADSATGHSAITAFFASVSNALRGLAPIAGALLAGVANVIPRLLNALGNLGRALGPALIPVIGLTSRALSGLLDVVNRLSRGMATSISRALASMIPEMRRVEAETRTMAGAFRVALPGMGQLTAAQTAKIRGDLHNLGTVFHALGPLVQALGPVFRVAFQAATVAVKIQAFWLEKIVQGETAVIHGLIGAIHSLADAWNALRSAAGHAVHFVSSFSSTTPGVSPRGGSPPHRALGGFINGPFPGAAVAITAHAGEVIVNPRRDPRTVASYLASRSAKLCELAGQRQPTGNGPSPVAVAA
jgi:hypothetical protein